MLPNISHIFFKSSRFDTWQKSQDKNLNILSTKRAFEVNKKNFLSFLKNFQLPKTVSDLRVRLEVCIFCSPVPLLYVFQFRGRRCLIFLNGVLFTEETPNELILFCMDYDEAFRLEKAES